MTTESQQQRSEQREWTAKTVLELWQRGGAGCDTNSRMVDIAIAHNDALEAEKDWSAALYQNLNDEKKTHRKTLEELAAERQRRKQAEQAMNAANEAMMTTARLANDTEQQLLSAQAALKWHNENACCDSYIHSIDLSLLHQHDAELKAQWEKDLCQKH